MFFCNIECFRSMKRKKSNMLTVSSAGLKVFIFFISIYFTAFGIQCYECTTQPGGKTNCSSILSDPSVGKIKCGSMYDRCMRLEYSKSPAGQNTTVTVEQWNCANSSSCDPKNDMYSKYFAKSYNKCQK